MSAPASIGRSFLLVIAAATMLVASAPANAAHPPAKTSTSKVPPRFQPRAVGHLAAALAQLNWDWNRIDLSNAVVKVNGAMHLTLRQDGSYTFSGHLHNGGVFSYDTALAYAVKDSQNRVYTFTHQGHVQGLGDGSRDDDWAENGTNPAIAANWASIIAGSGYGSARSDFNWGALAGDLKSAIGFVGQVVSIVGPIIAKL